MSTHTKSTHIKGVIPAMFSTFDENEALDLDRARGLVDYLVGAKVDALYINGSTGEGFLMTDEERKIFAEAVINHVDGRIPVIVHIGSIGTKRSIDLAAHAKAIGADAVSSVPPFYYPFSEESIYRYYKNITEAVDLPMIVYNISLAGMMNSALVERLAELKGVSGLKFTSTQHWEISALKKKMGEDFMIYSGADEMATQGLLAGSDGIIGSFYNLLPDTFNAIYQLCTEGKYHEAFEIQKPTTEFILAVVALGHFGVMKQLMNESGVDVGFVRRPFIHPDKKTVDGIWKLAEKLVTDYPAMPMEFVANRTQ